MPAQVLTATSMPTEAAAMHYQAASFLTALSQEEMLSFSRFVLSSNQHEATEKVRTIISYWQMDVAFKVMLLIS